MKWILLRRRARNDLPQLVAITALIATSTALGLLGPGLVLDTLDEGAREAVAEAGRNADLIVSTSVGTARPGEPAAVTAAGMVTLADSLADGLPPGLAAVYSGSTLAVISGETGIRAIDDVRWEGAGKLAIQLAMITDHNAPQLTVTEGRLPNSRPADSLEPVEVVLSQAAADAAGVEVGQLLTLDLPPRPSYADEQPVPDPIVEIVGIVETADPSNPLWYDSPEVWTPRQRPQSGSVGALTRFTALAAPDGVQAASTFLDYPFSALVRMRIDPQLLTGGAVAQVISEASVLRASGQSLAPVSDLGVQTALPEALRDYPLLAQAALAQMSVMMAGVIGVAAVVLVLLSRLLVAQRAPVIALESARGASARSLGLRALIESAVVTAVGILLGLTAAIVSPMRDALPIVVIAIVALLATPVQTVALARRLWTGRREPANRRDRQALARRSRGRRLVVELALIALAGAALVSLRGRGLLQNRTGGIDPLLALAPLLLAIAVTVVVIRVYPYPLRAVSRVAQRSRGPLGLLGAVRARSAIAALPLLALTLGVALATSGSLLVNTVHDGQDEAGWQRVGADARISPMRAASIGPDVIDALRAAPAVDAVSAVFVRGSVGLDLGTTGTSVTVIAIDSAYPDVVDALPDGPSSASLRTLLDEPSTGESISIVVDEATGRQLLSDDIAMYYGPAYVPLHVVGTTRVAPEGYLDGPFAYIVFDAVAPLMPEEYAPNSVLLSGDGAAAAVAPFATSYDVLTRSGWVEQRRDVALVAGVQHTMLFSIVAVALLAIAALVATVISGARARGRALSLLRTLGMAPRLGWWLALAELAPLVLAAVLGGITAGIAVVLVLAPSLGLDVLSGGLTVPTASFSPIVFIGLAAAALLLLLLGTLADVLVHRRDKLSEVLRVGETV
jgi:putative ABC transport system permease protein